MKKIVRAIILFLVLSGLIFGAVTLVNHKKKELSQAPKYGSKPRTVTVSTAVQGTLTRKKSYLAVVQPVRKTRVSAQVQARVASVLVDEGDTVNPDQALVRLDTREIEHSLASIRARIEEAGAELAGNQATAKALKRSLEHWQAEKQRYQALSEKELASKSRAESAAEKAAEVKGRLNAAKEKSQAIRKRIESLRQQEKERQIKLEYHTLVSPYQGIVTERLVDPGDLATPSKVLLVIEI